MDVVLSIFQHVQASDLLQKLEDAHTVKRVHVTLEKLPTYGHHLAQLQHICCHHQLLNILHVYADRP